MTIDVALLNAEPSPEIRFRRRVVLRSALGDLWRARALIRSLAERDLRVRYKQAVLGFAWSILNPIILLVAFTIIFEHAAHINTKGIPYPIFAYVGLLPWTFFSEAVAVGSQGIVAEKALLNKVQFPREAFVLADITVAVADLCMAALALIVLCIVEGFVPHSTSYWVLICLPIIFAFSVGLALAFSALVVYFRDMTQLVPVILQLGLFATPVAYSFNVIPKSLQPVYAIINPMGPAIDGIRQSVLYGHHPSLLPLLVAAVCSGLYMVGGYIAFKRMEMGFADIA